jgi:hypothetical protein
MTFNELKDIFQTPALMPWEHDYYAAHYITPKTNQEFLDHAYTSIENLNGIWYEIAGNMAYFVVKKGTVIPENFADSIQSVTDVPEKPTEEGTE